MATMCILTIYELDEYGLNIHLQQVAADEFPLKEAVVTWTRRHYPDHFQDEMFHDAPSGSIEDNYQSILLWSEFADNAGGLRFLIRPADEQDTQQGVASESALTSDERS